MIHEERKTVLHNEDCIMCGECFDGCKKKALKIKNHKPGTKILSVMEVGEPDFDIPECVAQAAKAAYDKHQTHYTHSLGHPDLRQAIADFYKKEYNVDVDPGCIVVTSGSSPAILLTLMHLLHRKQS